MYKKDMKYSNCKRNSDRTSSTSAKSFHLHHQRTRSLLQLRWTCCLVFVLIIAFGSDKVQGKPGPLDFSKFRSASDEDKSSAWTNKDFDFDFELESKDDREQMEGIISIIVGVVVFFIVAIFAFILCLCCPICVLAKMRSRRRGVVYRSAVTTTNGTTVTTAQNRAGTTITVSGPSRSQNVTPQQVAPLTAATNAGTPQIIAISNNSNQANKPYPVQQSVTIVPVITPQPQYGPVPTSSMHAQGYSQPQHASYPVSMPPPQPTANKEQYPSDLPPPYPGLPREMDSANLPYNPYYTEESGTQASAPFMKQ